MTMTPPPPCMWTPDDGELDVLEMRGVLSLARRFGATPDRAVAVAVAVAAPADALDAPPTARPLAAVATASGDAPAAAVADGAASPLPSAAAETLDDAGSLTPEIAARIVDAALGVYVVPRRVTPPPSPVRPAKRPRLGRAGSGARGERAPRRSVRFSHTLFS